MGTRTMAMTAFLGNVVMSSLSDVAMPVFVHGLTPVLRDAYIPMVKALMSPASRKALKANMSELKEMGLTVEHLTNARFAQIFMFDNVGSKGTKLENGIEKMSAGFGTYSGMNIWNNFGQTVAGSADMARVTRLAKKATLTQKDANYLSTRGIDNAMRKRIAAAMDEFSYKEGGITVYNSNAWPADVKKAWDESIFRGSRSQILQKGVGDIPIAMDSEVGKSLGQFMTHMMVSHNRILMSSMQRADKEVMMGLTSLVAMGSLTYFLQELSAGREPSDDWRVWVAEGVDKSSIAALPFLGNDAILEKVGLGVSNLVEDEEFRKYEKKVSDLSFGAASGYVTNVMKGAAGVSDVLRTGETSASNIKAGRGAIPLNTVPYLRGFFNNVQEHLIDDYGK